MYRLLAPVALVLSTFHVAPAEAARCPAGKIYRVSLGVCAAKSANMQFVKHPRPGRAFVAARTERVSAPMPPRVERDLVADDEETEVARSFAPAPEPVRAPFAARGRSASTPAASFGGSPYGALR